ncbi:hypothetical protein ABT127_35640 [Streptomyces sp. NPDC001904]|uniref:hypothetical protein n=1 Tax=Streptomyces sp. NPDC001904 TaxID=3154531 RepID=UPI00331B3601
MKQFDSLPPGEGFAEFGVRDKFITATVRFIYFDTRSTIVYRAMAIPLLSTFLLGGVVYLLVELPVGLGIFASLVFIITTIFTLVKIAGAAESNSRFSFYSTLMRFIVGSALIEVSLAVYFTQRMTHDSNLVWVLLASLSGGLVAATIWALAIAVASTFTMYVMKEEDGVKRFDGVLLRWVDAASKIQRHRHRLHRSDALKECLIAIEQVARRVDGVSYPSRLSGFLEPHQKMLMRDEAQRMSEVFRNHKTALVKASKPEDIDAILESMMAGVKALAIGDISALLENAPDHVSRSDRMRRFAVWILPPVTLICAGLLLPMIPAVASQGAAAGSLRWSLIVAGVLSVVAAQKDVAARINDTLGKAMSWK